MGEMADYILDGDDCQECGEYLGPGDGFPRTCASCRSQAKVAQAPAFRTPVLDARMVMLTLPANTTVRCPVCNRKVRAIGYVDHQRDTHSAPGISGKHYERP